MIYKVKNKSIVSKISKAKFKATVKFCFAHTLAKKFKTTKVANIYNASQKGQINSQQYQNFKHKKSKQGFKIQKALLGLLKMKQSHFSKK